MRGNEFQINYGGEWLDVDAQSVGGFDFTTLWTLDSTRITEKGRTLDLSVPATSKNTRVFNDHKLIPGDGVRRGINGMVVAGGVNITGTIYVSEYSGGRYSLMMAYGQSFGGFKRVNYAAAFAADTMTLVASDVPKSCGVVPDFGWYEYGNETAPHATVYDSGALLFPSANLGHIIDALAASLGYTVNYPHPILGRGYQAHAYGLVMSSFGVQSFQGGADVSGSAMNGFSYTLTGAVTLADLGLEVVVQKRARGVTLELVYCEVFRATKPVHISIPANSNVVVFGNNSYTLYNDWEGTQGAEFDLVPGDTFSFARPNEWHKVAGEYYWNRYKTPHAFENYLTVTFAVARSKSNPIPGETMRLASALPEQPLEWWLDAYCNIIFAAWTVDEATKTITVKTYGERYGDALADAGNHISLEKEKMIAIESVKKYVDGFAQENHTRCDGKYDNLGSLLPFDRVLAMYNEYLEKSRDMDVIPFNDGGIQGGHDERFYLYLNDVRPDGEGGYTYDGVLTVFFENNANTDGAVSLQEILNLGVGLDFNDGNDRYDFSRSMSVSVRVLLPLFRFAEIGGETCVSLHGRDFVVRNAKWSEGVARLEMMSVPRLIRDVPRYFPNAIQDYDGNWYDAVVIGDQVWLSSNLRTTHYADGTPIPAGGSTPSDTDPYYYDYSSSGIPLKDRGYLYNWPAVMKGAASSDLNPSGVQGIAPTGWHVPSDAEWMQLTNYVGSVPEYILNNNSTYIAKALASQNYWNASTNAYAVGNDLMANNKTLFGGVPAGDCNGSSFYNAKNYTIYACATQNEGDNEKLYIRQLDALNARVLRFNYGTKDRGRSVRCVCDLSPLDFAAWYYDQYGSYNHQL